MKAEVFRVNGWSIRCRFKGALRPRSFVAFAEPSKWFARHWWRTRRQAREACAELRSHGIQEYVVPAALSLRVKDLK